MRNCVTHSYACDCREQIFKDAENKIESLTAQLKQRDEIIKDVFDVIGFYAASSSWGGDNRLGSDIDESDCTYVEKWNEHIGGKRARAFLTKHEQITKEKL